jgi:hypothetical protein
MAYILTVQEDFGSRGAGVDSQYTRTFTRCFEVITTDDQVAGLAVLSAIDPITGIAIPPMGSYYHNGVPDTDPRYEFSKGSFVTGLKAEPWDSSTAWKVTVEYGKYVFEPNPLIRKVRCQFGGERTEKVIIFDKEGNPIINSTGDRYGEPITIDDHITTMNLTRNELVSTYDPLLASEFSNTINHDVWNGMPARKFKMGIIETSEEQWDAFGEQWYYTVSYPIQIAKTTWIKTLLDQGFNELDSYGNTKPIQYEGQPVSDPVLLDGAGHPLNASGYGYGSPVTMDYDVYDESDWSGLHIDLSLRLGV